MFFKVKIIRKYCKLYSKMFYDAFQHQKHLDRIKNPNENVGITKTTEPIGFFISKEQVKLESTGIIRTVMQPNVSKIAPMNNHSFILEEERKRLESINTDQNPSTKKKIKKKVRKDRSVKSTSDTETFSSTIDDWSNIPNFSSGSNEIENVVFPPNENTTIQKDWSSQNIDLPVYEPVRSNIDSNMKCPLTIEQLNLSDENNKATMGTETHNYDGHLPKTSLLNSKLNSLVKSTSNIDRKNSVINLCNEVSNARSSSINPISISFFQTLINDWGTNNNFDSSNNLCADDLLYVLAIEWNKIKECNDKETMVSFVDELCIQFADMQTGICREGRTTRLWQIALTYIEWCIDKEVNEDSLAFDLI